MRTLSLARAAFVVSLFPVASAEVLPRLASLSLVMLRDGGWR